MADQTRTEGKSETASSGLRVLAGVQDIFFLAKINAAAKRTGVAVEVVQREDDLIEKAAASPSMVLLDLNHPAWNVMELIGKLKASTARQPTQIVGYLSHVQQDLIREAQKAGCDVVLPRSVFSQNLDELLRQLSCHLNSCE